MNQVILNKKAQKQLRKTPAYIQANFQKWVRDVERLGIEEIRKIPGYHDEPVSWYRSTRLSRSYRAYYVEQNGEIIIEVIGVNNHEYKKIR